MTGVYIDANKKPHQRQLRTDIDGFLVVAGGIGSGGTTGGATEAKQDAIITELSTINDSLTSGGIGAASDTKTLNANDTASLIAVSKGILEFMSRSQRPTQAGGGVINAAMFTATHPQTGAAAYQFPYAEITSLSVQCLTGSIVLETSPNFLGGGLTLDAGGGVFTWGANNHGTLVPPIISNPSNTPCEFLFTITYLV